MEGDAELRDPEDQEHEDRQDDRELDERLAVLAFGVRESSCVLECAVHLVESAVRASAELGGSPDCRTRRRASS